MISRRFTADAEYDGIELTYNDNVTDAQEVIKLPLSGLATNYKRLSLQVLESMRLLIFVQLENTIN